MTRKQLAILGGGTSGTMTANRLRRRLEADQAGIHLVDCDDRHACQPRPRLVPSGRRWTTSPEAGLAIERAERVVAPP